MQVTSIQQNTTSTANAASASIKGVEFDLEAVLTESLTLTSGVAWMDGQYDDFPNPVVNPASPTQAPVTLANAGGNKTIRTPELTGYVGLDHVLTTTIGTITTSVNVSYNDGYFWAPDERYAQDGYTLVSGTLGWRSQDDTLGISLWGKNLTDEEYLLQGVPSAYGDLAVYAAPRTFGVTVSTTF
jgi:iron complex outermembrane receptor protein